MENSLTGVHVHICATELGLRMHMMPRVMPCQCALRMRINHVEMRCQKLIVRALLKSTMVESSMKSEHNFYPACEDSLQRAFFFWTFSCSLLALLASTVHNLTSLLSLCQCRQPSAAFSTRLRKTRILWRAVRGTIMAEARAHTETDKDCSQEAAGGDKRLCDVLPFLDCQDPCLLSLG